MKTSLILLAFFIALLPGCQTPSENVQPAADPDTFANLNSDGVIIDGRLMLQHSEKALNLFSEDLPGNVKLADGFQFTEGPVWHPDGFLLFSDPNTNVIYRYDPVTRNISIYMTKSGYAGFDIGAYRQPGSNGLAIDWEGRLIVCQHGNRRVIRLEKKGPVTILADHYNGGRLNSPNDVAVKSDSAIYFTDPPYGLPKAYDDGKTLYLTAHTGLYKIRTKNGGRLAADNQSLTILK